MNTSKKYFESKEHYLSFKKAWAEFINGPDAKPTYDERYGTKYSGDADAFSHFLYAILRGRDPRDGFTLPRIPRKYIYRGWCYDSCECAMNRYLGDTLVRYEKYLKKLELANKPELSEEELLQIKREYWFIKNMRENFDKLLKPFGGTVSLETLVQAMRDYQEKNELS